MENSLLVHPTFKGRRFFPTKSDKKPKVLHWKEDALPAEMAMASWLGEEHWAMPTGDGLFVVDVDTKNGGKEEDVYALGFPKGTFRVKTPSGGCHLYYKDGGLKLGNSVQKLGKGIDIRAEGGYVCIPPMPGYAITCDHDPKLVLPPDVKLPQAPELKLVSSTDIDQYYAEGTRNTSLFHVGSSMRARGIPEEGIFAALSALNAERCNPPLPQSEVERITQSVLGFERGVVQSGPAARLCILTATDIQKRDGEAIQSFIWKEHILDKMPNLLYAEGGMGKTTLSLVICQDLLKNDPTAKIMWLPAENNMVSTRIQMNAFEMDYNRFLVLERATGGYSIDFADPEDLNEFNKLVAMHKPRLVVVDSLGSMSSVDINSNAIRGVMKNVQDVVCEQNGASLLYIHHENKSELASARNKSMGSNMILAQVRMALRLTAGSKPSSRILTAEKFNLNVPDPLEITSIAEGQFDIGPAILAGSVGNEALEGLGRHVHTVFSSDLRMTLGDFIKSLEVDEDVMVPTDISWDIFWPHINKVLGVQYDKSEKTLYVQRLLKRE